MNHIYAFIKLSCSSIHFAKLQPHDIFVHIAFFQRITELMDAPVDLDIAAHAISRGPNPYLSDRYLSDRCVHCSAIRPDTVEGDEGLELLGNFKSLQNLSFVHQGNWHGRYLSVRQWFIEFILSSFWGLKPRLNSLNYNDGKHVLSIISPDMIYLDIWAHLVYIYGHVLRKSKHLPWALCKPMCWSYFIKIVYILVSNVLCYLFTLNRPTAGWKHTDKQFR